MVGVNIMSMKDNLENLKQSLANEKAKKEKEAEDLDNLMQVSILGLIKLAQNELLDLGWSFDFKHVKRHVGDDLGNWELDISNKDTEFAQTQLLDGKITIGLMFGDDKNMKYLGEKIGVSYSGICTIYRKENFLSEFQNILIETLSNRK